MINFISNALTNNNIRLSQQATARNRKAMKRLQMTKLMNYFKSALTFNHFLQNRLSLRRFMPHTLAPDEALQTYTNAKQAPSR